MSQGTLTIYNASAGSGKTYTLTGIYLSSLFRSRYNYRKILAVTFTNKATAEMKSRILESLYRLSVGEQCEYLDDLMSQTRQAEDWIRKEAGQILNLILHDFSRFSVSTIDSFFQKILRAFAREAGLHSGYNIELDNDIWLTTAIDEMISSAPSDKQLKNWLISYAISNIDSGKTWNLKSGIMRLAKELFSEKFRLLSENELQKLEDKQFLTGYIGKLGAISFSFEKQMKESGNKAAALIGAYHVTDDMFYYKGQGVPRFVQQLLEGDVIEINKNARAIMNDPPKWSTGKISPQLENAVAAGLGDVLKDAIVYYDSNIVRYITAKVITSNIYALGILTDILVKIRELTSSENTFLFSEAGEFLRLITGNDQCPFIYEKVGNTYENFMIDEFQDTSMIQWKNFDPLITNSRAQGFDNLVVGDIKQSIYRWRNSDWKILRSMMTSAADDTRIITKPLTVNWRSRSNIIVFNNTLFSVLPSILDERLKNDSGSDRFDSLYSEAEQSDPGKKEGGLVRIEFVKSDSERIWEATVLERLPSIIESVQDNGYSASDIGIIVRDGRKGEKVLRRLIEYSGSCTPEQKSKYNYTVVSDDSLLLQGSPAVNFIISALYLMNDPSDMIHRTAMERFYLMAHDHKDAESFVPPVTGPSLHLPEGYEYFLSALTQKPLYESIENIIMFFGLGENSSNTAWLCAFQDCVLSFIANGNPDKGSFLEWWETSGSKKSVSMPANQDAMRVLTIHKAKGLEFSVVILPFISWPLDHPSNKQPLLWVKPDIPPFNELGVVPVKCAKELEKTIFSQYYVDEKYSIYLDNLNLLYVATTRAKDALLGFAPDSSAKTSIATTLRQAFIAQNADTLLGRHFDPEMNVFQYGDLPGCDVTRKKARDVSATGYPVTYATRSLKLKLHGENYFSADDVEIRKRINYGKIMHEVFEAIDVPEDVPSAVKRLVLEGKLPEAEAPDVVKRIELLIGDPQVSPWFSKDNKVVKEAGILLTSGNIRRPDRVIFNDDKTIVIDFKFGNESESYLEQIGLYRSLLADMGYNNIEAYIWYVDKNKVISA